MARGDDNDGERATGDEVFNKRTNERTKKQKNERTNKRTSKRTNKQTVDVGSVDLVECIMLKSVFSPKHHGEECLLT